MMRHERRDSGKQREERGRREYTLAATSEQFVNYPAVTARIDTLPSGIYDRVYTSRTLM